jgi:hypothetical protein
LRQDWLPPFIVERLISTEYLMYGPELSFIAGGRLFAGFAHSDSMVPTGTDKVSDHRAPGHLTTTFALEALTTFKKSRNK